MKKLPSLLLLLVIVFASACINPYKIIPKEFVHAYLIQNHDMETMIVSKESANNMIYADFEQQRVLYRDDFQRIKTYYDRAFQVKRMSDSAVQVIALMKADIIAEINDISPQQALTQTIDFNENKRWGDIYISDDYFDVDSENGKATLLKNTIANYRDRLLSKDFLLYPRDSFSLHLNLDTRQKLKTATWEEYYFHKRPAASAIYELTKWQYNIRDAENSMIRYLYSKIYATSYKFDAVEAQITPKSYIVKLGSNFEADVSIAAYNTSERPYIEVNQKQLDKFNDRNMGSYSEVATKIGKKKVKGYITIMDPITGQRKDRPFETEYEVIP